MRITAKRVILELLSAVPERAAPASVLVEACKLFGITENSTRVTLARLLASGAIDTAARGAYRLGGRDEALTQQVTGWRELEKQVRRWDGGWLCAHTGDLGRSDRGQLRRRARALQLLGFRALARGLDVRPDNLEGGCQGTRERLHALGLERGAAVFRAVDFDEALDARARGLWEGLALTASYRRTRERLERWLTREPSLSRVTAARESYLLGAEAVRQVLFDPRLPEPLVDVGERRALVDVACRFDAVGRRIWQRLFGIPHRIEFVHDDEARAVLQ